MKKALQGLMAGMCLLSINAFAQDAAQAKAEQLVASLHFQDGDIALPAADAHFHLSPQFRYLDKADTRKVLEQLWGNPPDDDVLGMVVPAQSSLLADDGWAVVVTYAGDGYVPDKDASSIDYAKMLKQMQDATRENNEQRKKDGYRAFDLVGWAVPPHYDADSKKLYWARELKVEGSQVDTLNYDIRVLGRRGFLSLNAIAAMPQLGTVRDGMQQLLPMAEFDAGARYADYNKSTDKLAAYGIAALIGGGLAAKAGLFAKLGLVLAKFWKLGLVGLAALGSGIKRFFGGGRGKGGVVS